MASFDEVIPPGKVGKVTAKIDTKEMRGPMDRGITLTTDDPDQQQVALFLHVDVAGSVLLLPRGNLDLRPGHPSLPPVARLLVRQDPGEKGEMRVTDPRVGVSWLRASARRVESPEPAAEGLPEALPGDVVLEVKAAGEVPEGTTKLTVQFGTGLPTEPTIEVPLVVFVRPRIQVTGDAVRFGPPEPDGLRRAAVVVSLRDDLGDAAVVVEGPEGMKSTLASAGAHRYQVQLTWPAKAEPSGTVVFRAGSATRSLPIVGDPGPH